MKKALIGIFTAGSLILATACYSSPIQSGSHEPVTLTAWTAYWDMPGGMAESELLGKKLEYVSYFAATFKDDGSLFISDELKEGRKGHEKPTDYLTIVNDVEASGKSAAKVKDLDILHKTLDDKDVRQSHIEEILEFAKNNGYGGIEIDYERIFKDDKLVKPYLSFLEEIKNACDEENLKLRVILEPGMDFKAGFPEGPEYCVMLYNLYGTHSNAGPKADGRFIEKTIDKMEALPGKKSVALSNGGCVWEASLLKLKHDKGRFITEAKAVELQEQFKAEVKRDEASACLYFNYTDQGQDYTVWYADSETLNAWITVAANKGIRTVSLWRLGGSTDITDVDAHGK